MLSLLKRLRGVLEWKKESEPPKPTNNLEPRLWLVWALGPLLRCESGFGPGGAMTGGAVEAVAQ